eukprot:5245551-Amphidinium_carterae.1
MLAVWVQEPQLETVINNGDVALSSVEVEVRMSTSMPLFGFYCCEPMGEICVPHEMRPAKDSKHYW